MEKVTFRGDKLRSPHPSSKVERAIIFGIGVLCAIVLERIEIGVEGVVKGAR